MMSLLLAMAMLCTLVPTAFAASSRRNITIDTDLDTDEEDYCDFDDEDYDIDVYNEIIHELEAYYDDRVDADDYYIIFSNEGDETILYLNDEREDFEEGIDLDLIDDLYLEIDPDDDQWDGSYAVYYYRDDPDEDDPVIYGDITISFDGRGSGDTDVELTIAGDLIYLKRTQYTYLAGFDSEKRIISGC